MVGLKKQQQQKKTWSHTQNPPPPSTPRNTPHPLPTKPYTPKMVSPRDIAGNTEEEKEILGHRGKERLFHGSEPSFTVTTVRKKKQTKNKTDGLIFSQTGQQISPIPPPPPPHPLLLGLNRLNRLNFYSSRLDKSAESFRQDLQLLQHNTSPVDVELMILFMEHSLLFKLPCRSKLSKDIPPMQAPRLFTDTHVNIHYSRADLCSLQHAQQVFDHLGFTVPADKA